jgi:predicted ester cyclase
VKAILNQINTSFVPIELEKIRNLWKTHSIAEDKRELDILITTLTEDCIYEIVGSDFSWKGRSGARKFYEELIGGMPDIKFDLQHIVFGPQGVFEEAKLSGTFQRDILGFKAHGQGVEGWVAIFFPWVPEKQLFSGERVYIDLAKILGTK